MSFTSIPFYILFAVTILLLLAAERSSRKNMLRKGILCAASIVFCLAPDWRFFAIVALESVLVWFLALRIEKKHSKGSLCIGIILIAGCLAVFKYYNFFADTFRFFGIPMQRMALLLPIGISFYSFSAIGYLTDVYQGACPSEENFADVFLYMAFFPKLTAGPIISAKAFFKQLTETRTYTIASVADGIQIVMMGLIKKNVLADHIAVFVDSVYGNLKLFNAPTLLLAVFSYGVQIYFDFSGYSDIAVGCAKCLGFDLPRNFNLPYLSRNITEFWKRWHITLSEWLMHYIYIPLGGNRRGYARQLVNLMLTMLIGGLWHGAGWNFVLWGAIQGALLCLHKQYLRIRKLPKDHTPGLPTFLAGVVGTWLLVNFCWIFFRITDLAVIGDLLSGIIHWQSGVAFYSDWAFIGFAVLLISTAAAWFRSVRDGGSYANVQGFYVIRDLGRFWNLVLFFVTAGLILGLAYAYSNPFIYAAF